MKLKLAIILMCLAVISFLALRFITPEDSWVCQEGEWVKHGSPSAPKPSTDCTVISPNIGSQTQAINTVKAFYDWYLKYDGNPISDGSYKTHSALTDKFKQKITKIVAEFDGGGYDPILCAQDKPKQYFTGLMSMDKNTATLDLSEKFGSGTTISKLKLKNNDGNWQIDDVVCLADNPDTSTSLIVYFNNTKRAQGNTDCGLVYGVKRLIDGPIDTHQAALDLLFHGPTSDEKDQGFSSMFSIQTASILNSVKVVDGTAYVDLADIRKIIPNASSSCGSRSFISQVEETLKEDRQIHNVRFAINGDPQTFYDWIQIGCDKTTNNCDKTPFQNSR